MRNALMNEHADIFPQIPEIVRTLPNPIDQMKVFELIQIIPTPTKSALRSGDLVGYTISTPRIMGYLRNNSMFAFGKADRARTSATFREFSTPCGYSTANSSRPSPSSTKSKPRRRARACTHLGRLTTVAGNAHRSENVGWS